jgi:hypothetical protein
MVRLLWLVAFLTLAFICYPHVAEDGESWLWWIPYLFSAFAFGWIAGGMIARKFIHR